MSLSMLPRVHPTGDCPLLRHVLQKEYAHAMQAATILAADFGCPNNVRRSFDLCMADMFTVHQDSQAQLV